MLCLFPSANYGSVFLLFCLSWPMTCRVRLGRRKWFSVRVLFWVYSCLVLRGRGSDSLGFSLLSFMARLIKFLSTVLFLFNLLLGLSLSLLTILIIGRSYLSSFFFLHFIITHGVSYFLSPLLLLPYDLSISPSLLPCLAPLLRRR